MELRSLLKRLSDRERVLLSIALALLIVFLIYQLIFAPIIKARNEYDIRLSQLERRFDELKVIGQLYESEKEAYTSLQEMLKNKSDLSVLTYLENISASAGIKDNIEYIKPQGTEVKNGMNRSMVEIKIDAIPIQNLALFLYEVEENRDGLLATYLRIKPFFRDRTKVDAVVVIEDVTLP